jgi:hypothetical protein
MEELLGDQLCNIASDVLRRQVEDKRKAEEERKEHEKKLIKGHIKYLSGKMLDTAHSGGNQLQVDNNEMHSEVIEYFRSQKVHYHSYRSGYSFIGVFKWHIKCHKCGKVDHEDGGCNV